MAPDYSRMAQVVNDHWRQLGSAARNYKIYVTDAPAKPPMGVESAHFESFAGNLRALREFFYRDDEGKPDDARAVKFFKQGANRSRWLRERPAEPPRLNDYKERANKSVSHPTTTRPAAKRYWEIAAIVGDLDLVSKAFEAATLSYGEFPFGRDTPAPKVSQMPTIAGSTSTTF